LLHDAEFEVVDDLAIAHLKCAADATKPSALRKNVGAAQVELSQADVARIEAIMDDAHGRVDVFRPFGWAMRVWD
jgi:hypothetical protein